jgi:exopolysaccharide production protein ExoQ
MIRTEFRLDKLRAAIFFIAIFLLGMPLGGVIPTPPGNSRETVRIEFLDKAGDEKFNTMIIWSILYSTAFLLLLGRKKEARTAFLRQPFAFLTVLLVAVSAIWSSDGPKALVAAIQLLGASAIALMASVRYAGRLDQLLRHGAWALGLNQIINLLMIWLLPGETSHPDGRWAGVTGSANYLGALAFCGAWAAAAMLLTESAESRLPYWAFLLGAVVSLYGAGSATSTACALLAITILLYQAPMTSRSRFPLGRRAILLLGATLLLVVGITYGVSNIFELLGKRNDFTGRVYIWEGGLSLLREHPFIGHGYGTDTESLGVTHWATSFHNGYLDIAVKLGFLGLVSLAGVFVCFWRQMRALKTRSFSCSVWYIPAITIAVLFYNLLEAAFLGARNPTWLIVLVLTYSVALQSSGRFRLNNSGNVGQVRVSRL